MGRRSRHSSLVQYLVDEFVGDNPKRQALLDREMMNAEIAQQIFDLRTKARLTQRQLAEEVGTTASVICQMEDADYRGHSLSMLQRIASALGSRIEVQFVREKPTRRPRSRARRTSAA